MSSPESDNAKRPATAGSPKRGLGRGLSALIPQAGGGGGAALNAGPEAFDRERDAPQLREISLRSITLNANQPRKTFGRGELDELTESIRQTGVLQPVVVRPIGVSGFELIAGERRFRAASAAGLASIPAVVRSDVDDRASLAMALVENVQREDLNIIEASEAYRELIQRFGMTQSELARAVGKSQPAIANALRLLALPEPIRDSVRRGQISEGHAKVILSVAAPDMIPLWTRIVESGMSVREAEREALAMRSGGKRSRSRAPVPSASDPALTEVAQRLSANIGTKVRVIGGKGERGTIEIAYYDHQQLDGLVERILH